MREIAVAVPEEAQHRHHAVDGVVERRRRRRCCARVNAWRSGRRSSSSSISAPGLRLMWPPSGRICRSSSSTSCLVAPAHVARLAGHAERRIGERDQRLQARHAVARLDRGVAQVAHLPGQAAQEAAVEAHVGVVQDQRRLASARTMMRRAMISGCQAIGSLRALQRDPFVDQRAGVGAGDAGLGGAQMAQPAEAEQRRGPFVRRRRRSRTASGRRRSRPCRRRRSGRHRFRSRGCASAVRRSCGAISSRSALPAMKRQRGRADGRRSAPDELAKRAARQEARTAWPAPRSTRATSTRSPPSTAGVSRPADPCTYSEGVSRPANRLSRCHAAPVGRRRSRRARPSADRDRANGRAGCAGRRRASGSLAWPADLGGRDRPAAQAADRAPADRRRSAARPPRVRASRCNRPACRPA